MQVRGEVAETIRKHPLQETPGIQWTKKYANEGERQKDYDTKGNNNIYMTLVDSDL